MKSIIIALLFTVTFQAAAQDLTVGDFTASNPAENDIPLKIRNQIAELSKGILHGAPQFSMAGTVEVFGDGSYAVNGERFTTDSHTVVYGDLKPGAFIEVRGLLENGRPKLAKQIVVAEQNSSPPKKDGGQRPSTYAPDPNSK